jgi:hypothetical protein
MEPNKWKIIDPKLTIISLILYSIISWLIASFLHWEYWITFLIVVASGIITSIVAEIEDDMPGGFNDPISENTEHKKQ